MIKIKSRSQTGRVKSISADKQRSARVPGKRRSKSGKIYYERRRNRSDRNPVRGL